MTEIAKHLEALEGQTVRLDSHDESMIDESSNIGICVSGKLKRDLDEDLTRREYYVRIVDNYQGASGINFTERMVEEVCLRSGSPSVIVLKINTPR